MSMYLVILKGAEDELKNHKLVIFNKIVYNIEVLIGLVKA